MINAFVQMRMGSTRLPGKSLKDFCGYPLVQWVLHRVGKCEYLDHIVALLPDSKSDDKLNEFVRENLKVKSFRGSEEDVLSRFIGALVEYPCEHVMRVCADNPFVCPRELDRLINFHVSGGYDYSFNHVPKMNNGYADGFGAEIIRTKSLQSFASHAGDVPRFREHVTSFVWDNRELFKIGALEAPVEMAYPNLRFDIDVESDFDRLAKVGRFITIDSLGSEIIDAWLKLGELAESSAL